MQKHVYFLFPAFLLCVCLQTAEALPPGKAEIYKTVEHQGKVRELRIFVTSPKRPSASKRPAIVFFHGGGWVGGQPGQFDEHAAYFATRGVVSFQVEYRLLDRANNDPPDMCCEDAVDALKWVLANCDTYEVDPERIATAGGSAGGHLASYLGTKARQTAGGREAPAAMLLFNPVYDNGPNGWGHARTGADYLKYSPLHKIDEGTPPNIVFLGTQDKLIPVQTGELFKSTCEAAGVASDLHLFEGEGHGFFNVDRNYGRPFTETLVACDHFLRELGWIEGPHAVKPAVADNVVLITLDGLRSEEVFTGADPRLFLKELGVDDAQAFKDDYVRDSPEQQARALLPFLWQKTSDDGWMAGDIRLDSLVKVTNGRFFSYPGYNELLTGAADDQVDSNAKKYNRNVTVLEWLNRQPDLKGSVAAYCSWDVFPFIINDQRSGIEVNAGWEKLTVGPQSVTANLNFVADNLFHEWDSVRYDSFTAAGAILHLQEEQPRVLYVSIGETDDWAHAGRYDRYLLTARQNDNLIKTLWETTQSLEQYRDRTAFIVTTDHGRGDGREGWKNHSVDLPGSEYIWIAAFGAGISARGQHINGELTQSQIAATVAAALGYDFENAELPKKQARPAKPLPILGPKSYVTR